MQPPSPTSGRPPHFALRHLFFASIRSFPLSPTSRKLPESGRVGIDRMPASSNGFQVLWFQHEKQRQRCLDVGGGVEVRPCDLAEGRQRPPAQCGAPRGHAYFHCNIQKHDTTQPHHKSKASFSQCLSNWSPLLEIEVGLRRWDRVLPPFFGSNHLL